MFFDNMALEKDIWVAADESYQRFFGIEGQIQYDIQEEWGYKNGEKWGYIVYLDMDTDIDWIDYRYDYWTEDEKQIRDTWIAKLNFLQQIPCANISNDDKKTFKKMLGAVYVLALKKQYTDIPDAIQNIEVFVQQRNKEVARQLFLCVAGIVAVCSFMCLIINLQFWQWKIPWMISGVMGIIGAYVSVWMRYGKEAFTGLASRGLHYMEAISRLLIGAIFACVAQCLYKCGCILHDIPSLVLPYFYAVLGFCAGFSERMVPSLLEKIIEKTELKEK